MFINVSISVILKNCFTWVKFPFNCHSGTSSSILFPTNLFSLSLLSLLLANILYMLSPFSLSSLSSVWLWRSCALLSRLKFGNFSSPFGTFAIHWHQRKILRRSSQEIPPSLVYTKVHRAGKRKSRWPVSDRFWQFGAQQHGIVNYDTIISQNSQIQSTGVKMAPVQNRMFTFFPRCTTWFYSMDLGLHARGVAKNSNFWHLECSPK